MTDTTTCKKITVWEGPPDCFEAECDEYWSEDGGTETGITRCAHIHDVDICETHSTLAGEGGEWEHYEPAASWPCTGHAPEGVAR